MSSVLGFVLVVKTHSCATHWAHQYLYLSNLHQMLYHEDLDHHSEERGLVDWVTETLDLEKLDPTDMTEGSWCEELSGNCQLGAVAGCGASCAAVQSLLQPQTSHFLIPVPISRLCSGKTSWVGTEEPFLNLHWVEVPLPSSQSYLFHELQELQCHRLVSSQYKRAFVSCHPHQEVRCQTHIQNHTWSKWVQCLDQCVLFLRELNIHNLTNSSELLNKINNVKIQETQLAVGHYICCTCLLTDLLTYLLTYLTYLLAS